MARVEFGPECLILKVSRLPYLLLLVCYWWMQIISELVLIDLIREFRRLLIVIGKMTSFLARVLLLCYVDIRRTYTI